MARRVGIRVNVGVGVVVAGRWTAFGVSLIVGVKVGMEVDVRRASGGDSTAVAWFQSSDYWDYLAWCEETNLDIMRRFEAEGIEFAFPTTTTYLAGDPKRPLVPAHRGPLESP